MQLWLIITLWFDFRFRSGDGNGVVVWGCWTSRFRCLWPDCRLLLQQLFLCYTHSAVRMFFFMVISLPCRFLLCHHLPCHSNSLHFLLHVLHFFLGVLIKESIKKVFVLLPLVAHYLLESACRSLLSIRDGGLEREPCGFKDAIIAHVLVVQF